MINPATRTLVITRAGNRCEFCHWPQTAYELTFHVDHVIATQHGGGDDDSNLALACPYCNRKKGTNLTAIDPVTRAIAPLFHPRRDSWNAHFRWNGPLIIGITPTGRATASLLNMNDKRRIELRSLLIASGLFPAD